MNPNILLTSTTRWPLAARLAMGLAKEGCNVSAVCVTPGHPLSKTRAVKNFFDYNSLRPLKSLRDSIEAVRPDVVIPCDDRAVGHLHELHSSAAKDGFDRDELAALIERSLGSPSSYAIAGDRYALLECAQNEGIRVPTMKSVCSVSDLRAWEGRQSFPWVLKAESTFSGRGVRVAQNLDEAEADYKDLLQLFGFRQVLRNLVVNDDPFFIRPWMRNWRPEIIVQSFVAGRPANCAVICCDGVVLAGIAVEVMSTTGPVGPATIVRVVDGAEMMSAAEKIVRKLGVSGFCGFDFMIEEATGKHYLIEMNPRCTPLCHLQLGRGRDMITALRAKICGRPQVEPPPVTERELIAYFPGAWTHKSSLLDSCFQDIPTDEPALARALLNPWRSRNPLFRAAAMGARAYGRVRKRRVFATYRRGDHERVVYSSNQKNIAD
jgi:hypothetical protein